MSTIDDAARATALARFEDAEQTLMRRHAVTITRKHRLELREPALTARVIESGHGAPVVFVHGGGSSAAEWAPLLSELSGYRCLAVDRPGCGASDPFDYTGVDVRSHAVAFLESVLDELGLERASFVANSMGGLWSMWLALDRPDRVSSLALLGCPALLSGTSAPLPLRLLGLRGLNRVLFGLQRPSPKQMRTILEHVAGADAAARMSPEFVDTAYRAELVPGTQTAWRTLLERLVRLRGARLEFSENEIRRLRQRTLLVWGEDDAFGAPQHGRRACELLPDGRMELVAGGHLPWWDEPQRCAQLVSSFLARRTRPSAPPSPQGAGERDPTRTDAIAGRRPATVNQVAPASREPNISPEVAPKYSSSASPSPAPAKDWRKTCR